MHYANVNPSICHFTLCMWSSQGLYTHKPTFSQTKNLNNLGSTIDNHYSFHSTYFFFLSSDVCRGIPYVRISGHPSKALKIPYASLFNRWDFCSCHMDLVCSSRQTIPPVSWPCLPTRIRDLQSQGLSWLFRCLCERSMQPRQLAILGLA